MKIHNIEKESNGELDSYALDDLEIFGLDEVWYWYESRAYEGSGYLLARRGDLYDVHNMGNCSCYGPTEHFEFKGMTKEKVQKLNASKEYLDDIDCLLKEAFGETEEEDANK